MTPGMTPLLTDSSDFLSHTFQRRDAGDGIVIASEPTDRLVTSKIVAINPAVTSIAILPTIHHMTPWSGRRLARAGSCAEPQLLNRWANTPLDP